MCEVVCVNKWIIELQKVFLNGSSGVWTPAAAAAKLKYKQL